MSEFFDRWRADLDSMILAVERAISYSSGMSFDQFLDDTRTQDAVVMNLIVLSEAARGIPDDIKYEYPSIPWRQMRGFRNRVAHAAQTVDLALDHSVVWGILTNDLPPLLVELRRLAAAS